MNLNLFSSSFYSDLIPFSFDSHSFHQHSLSIRINWEHPFDYHICFIDEPTEEPIVFPAAWLHLLHLLPHCPAGPGPALLAQSAIGDPQLSLTPSSWEELELSAIAQVDKELELSSKSQRQWAMWNTESKGAHLMCLMICKIVPLGVYLSNNQQEKF